MFQRLKAIRRLPAYGLVTWRLFQDRRVSRRAKVILAIALLAAFSPLDALDWLLPPPAGTLALVLLVMQTFVRAAPEEVRAEHLAALGIEELD